MSHPLRKPLTTTISIGLLVKALLFSYAFFSAAITPTALMSGHDGGEYIAYAHAITSPSDGPLPPDIIRHDVGFPALLAVLSIFTFHQFPLPLLALIIQLASWVAAIVAFAKLLQSHQPPSTPLLLACAIGYPAALYYGQFNLTEQLFTALILWSLVLSQNNHYALATLLAGLSATVRSTGLLLSVSLLTASLLFPPQSNIIAFRLPTIPLRHLLKNALIFILFGVLPWLTGQLLVTAFLHTNISSHKPTFGLPFSGFRGFSDIGTARSIYILATIAFFLIAAIYSLWKNQPPRPLSHEATIFFVIFLSFHLCLKSLYYIDHTVFTLNYYDRYLTPLWPLALILFARYINWVTTAVLSLASLFLSLWWLHNYIPASTLS